MLDACRGEKAAQPRWNNETGHLSTPNWPIRLNPAPRLAYDVANSRRIVTRETPSDNDGGAAAFEIHAAPRTPFRSEVCVHGDEGGRVRPEAPTQPECGSHEKKRNAAIKPPTPHAATTTTSVQLNGVPMKPA
jgi:hypothetical protein